MDEISESGRPLPTKHSDQLVLDFSHVASFRKKSASKAIMVEIEAKNRTFDTSTIERRWVKCVSQFYEFSLGSKLAGCLFAVCEIRIWA